MTYDLNIIMESKSIPPQPLQTTANLGMRQVFVWGGGFENWDHACPPSMEDRRAKK
jgi:hypothetical protein